MLLSTALVFTALISSGCATLNCDKGCGVDAVSCDSNCNDCCSGRRVGGLIGRLRSAGCNDCGNGACSSCQTGAIGGGRMGMAGSGGLIGSGRMGAGIGGGRLGAGGMGAGGMGAGGFAGRGALGGGFGQGACSQCGMTGGGCMCIGNHSPYTPEFAGPHGPETGHYRYPYYTTRAPRDFLMANPPSIGR